MRKILLIEPDYHNKYQPLGLMKISTYHKNRNDEVVFYKGKLRDLKKQKWDRIYITSLFTFYYKKTIETIKYYYDSVDDPSKIFVGGVMATLMKESIEKEENIEGIRILEGLIDKPYILDSDDSTIVDTICPDYKMIDPEKNEYLDYVYHEKDSYIGYTTRGCIRKCEFCAVHKIEPHFKNYISITDQINQINQIIDKPLRDLKLMDNNILASNKLSKIVDELIELGYERDNKSYTRKTKKRTSRMTRYVDFNQGVDARLMTDVIFKQLSRLEVKPLRIAFDYADSETIEIYSKAIRKAAEYEFKTLSNPLTI
jgi:radical SAM superfamily enzyme YgiQ (UPF0313 family)